MMRTVVVTLGVTVGRRFHSVKAELVGEPIEYDDAVEGDRERAIKQVYAALRKMCEDQLKIMGVEK